MIKGNVNFVGFTGVIVLLSTLFLPQVVIIEGIQSPVLEGSIFGIIVFLLSSVVVMIQISLALPVLGFFFIPVTMGVLYILFRDVVPSLIIGVFGNTITGIIASLTIGVTLLIALMAILA